MSRSRASIRTLTRGSISARFIEPYGRELGRFFVRIYPQYFERVDPGSQVVTGFGVDRWCTLNAVTAKQAIEEFEIFHRQIAQDRLVIFGFQCLG